MDVTLRDNEKYLLSIIFPLYNSERRLQRTLNNFKSYFLKYHEKVDFCFVDNCSNDQTIELLSRNLRQDDLFRIIVEDTFLEIGPSLLRACEHSRGKFTLLWGDDDIPVPGFLSTLVNLLETENPSVIYYNRFRVGLDDRIGKGNLIEPLTEDSIISYFNTDLFIRLYFPNFTFISSIVFKTTNNSKQPCDVSDIEIFGYDWMRRVFPKTLKPGEKLLFYSVPLAIQNIPTRRGWNRYAPLYRLLGLNRLLLEWRKYGLIENFDARNVYKRSRLLLIKDILVMSKYPKLYLPHIREILGLYLINKHNDK